MSEETSAEIRRRCDAEFRSVFGPCAFPHCSCTHIPVVVWEEDERECRNDIEDRCRDDIANSGDC